MPDTAPVTTATETKPSVDAPVEPRSPSVANREASRSRMKALWASRKASGKTTLGDRKAPVTAPVAPRNQAATESNTIPTKTLRSNRKPVAPRNDSATGDSTKPKERSLFSKLTDNEVTLVVAIGIGLALGAILLLILHLIRTGKIRLPNRQPQGPPPDSPLNILQNQGPSLGFLEDSPYSKPPI